MLPLVSSPLALNSERSSTTFNFAGSIVELIFATVRTSRDYKKKLYAYKDTYVSKPRAIFAKWWTSLHTNYCACVIDKFVVNHVANLIKLSLPGNLSTRKALLLKFIIFYFYFTKLTDNTSVILKCQTIITTKHLVVITNTNLSWRTMKKIYQVGIISK